VLRLVAAGRTNGQIAEALFISRKTASVHVSNILAKLGMTSRTEVATWAVRTGRACQVNGVTRSSWVTSCPRSGARRR
jgi:DNA-binding NarL/FixJ family response regulator